MRQGFATSKIPRLAAMTLVVLVLGACAGATSPGVPSSEPSVVVTAPATPSPTPTASPSPDLSPFAATYTTIAAGGAAAVRQCDREKAGANGTLTDAKAIAQACRDGYVQYIAAMKAVAWGPAQPQADAVVTAAEACDAIVVLMINAADGATFRAAYARLPAAEDRLLLMADAMRKALGLPPAG
jgi:hypothetical protein